MAYKMIFCLRRLPGMDPGDFSAYWHDRHAELFKNYAEALKVRRYTQSHRLQTRVNDALRTYRGAPDGYDGVAEVWFDSKEEMLGAMNSPAGRAAADILIEDEKNFIDHPNSPIWISEEREIDIA